MHAVGLRELKAKLGEYVRRAKGGEVVLVTERGRVVAELRAPLSARDLPPGSEGLLPLVERGVLTLGGRNEASLYPRSRVRCRPGSAKSVLDAERGNR